MDNVEIFITFTALVLGALIIARTLFVFLETHKEAKAEKKALQEETSEQASS